MNIALDLTIDFERIGRSHNPPPFTYRLDLTSRRGFDGMVDALHRYVGRYLSSREFQVDVILDPDTSQGVVTIDGGRFGKGTIAPTPTPAPTS